VLVRRDEEPGGAACGVENGLVLLRVNDLYDEVDDVPGRAKLPGVALRAEDAQQVLERVAKPFAGTVASYSISFNTGESGYLHATEGTITITFPEGTHVPSSMSNITVNGTPANATSSGRSVSIVTPVIIQN
jgi:hypothetical protein